MKLLLDNNLSSRLLPQIEVDFPGSLHVRSVDLDASDDADVWRYAHQNGFAIVSKDDDFRQLSLLHGYPPKVVWLRVGNCSTKQLGSMIQKATPELLEFLESDEGAFLVLGSGRGEA